MVDGGEAFDLGSELRDLNPDPLHAMQFRPPPHPQVRAQARSGSRLE